MRTEEEKMAEIKAILHAFVDAVKTRGPYQPADVIEAAFGTIVLMSEKLGAEPRATVAHLLLASCAGDPTKAREAVTATAIDRGLVKAPEPLTGGDADVNVLVRVKDTAPVDPRFAGMLGHLVRYHDGGTAEIRQRDGWRFQVPRDAIERAPSACSSCGRDAQ